MGRDAKIRSLARAEVRHAQNSLGHGWAHVSHALRRGLVMSGVVSVVRTQDESVSAEARVSMLDIMCTEVDRVLGPPDWCPLPPRVA